MWLVITEVPPSLYYFNSTLGRLIAKEPSKFKVAGTKDKRAISTQKVCIPFVNAEKLKTASKGMKRNWRRSGERAYVGNFSYEKESFVWLIEDDESLLFKLHKIIELCERSQS